MSQGSAPDLQPGQWQAYHVPFKRDSVTTDELVELARAVVNTKLRVVEESSSEESWFPGLKSELENLEYTFVTERPELVERYHRLDDLLKWDEEVDFQRRAETLKFVLSEACYYITTSYDVRDWLLQDWMNTEVDLEPLYEFYRVGGWCSIGNNGVAYVEARFIDG